MSEFTVAHHASLLPVLFLLAFGRDLPARYWLVAIGWFISWFADSIGDFIGGAWWGWYLLLPVQVWFMLAAFVGPSERVFYAVALALLVPVSIISDAPGPEILITFIGSIAILWVARGPLAIPLYIYFGLGTIAYASMIIAFQGGGDYLSPWRLYRDCRLLAFLTFIAITAPTLIRQRGFFKWRMPSGSFRDWS